MRLLVACALSAVLFSCNCGSIVIGGGHGGGHGGGSGGSGGSGGGTGRPCTTTADCGTGACIDGMCCLAQSVCGKVCCGGASVCLFNACVTPGKDCHTANDCMMGEYCETALGEPPNTELDAGMCTQPPPAGGKCLALPPLCSGADDGGCIAPCEYHPPVGTLNAVARWQWGPTATAKPDYTDVWSTPVVGRLHDSNCDGVVNELDAPVMVFVSGNDFANAPTGTNCQGATAVAMGPTMCHTSVLRMIDGASGKEIWTLEKASMTSMGFAGVSPAIGDIDNDGHPDIVAVTGEGSVVLIDANGVVKLTSNLPIPGAAADSTFGWGGGLAVADMDGDGFPEIAYGSTVFSTTGGAITLKFTGMAGIGGGAIYQALATFADLDLAADGHLELLAGNTAYTFGGTVLWNNTSLPDGFPGVGDFDKDGKPEVALVGSGKLWILDAATGTIRLGPVTLPGTGSGGPPTVADFDGDGKPEVGIAMATFYSVLKPDFAGMKIDVLWSTPNHDLSSSVTGSTVFDFEGDGKAEVIYNDECFLWVFDGKTGAVRFAGSTTSFTGTEASLVADVDGDGRAEMVMISNGANPAASGGWGCLDAMGNPVTINGHTWVPTALPNKSHRGITLFGDSAHSWVGTRTLWSEHTYHVSNICDDRDSACAAPNVYGSIPKKETNNWTLSWLNNFRQNVQDKGLFDAPDATVSLTLECSTTLIAHVSVRNIGVASLPAGVTVGVFTMGSTTPLATGVTSHALFSGQIQTIDVALPGASTTDTYVAKIIIDPLAPTFHECREDNDESLPVTPACIL
jgi:hypothetical protein